jgi:ribosomal-protein-alanine N-acetyltransferase
MLLPDHWNKGLISEAIPKVINYGFNNMKLHSIAANINPNHAVSKKVLEKFKFKKEAYFKENHYFNGKFYDTEIYSLLNK